MKKYFFLLLFVIAVFILAFSGNLIHDENPFYQPVNFPEAKYDTSANKLSMKGFELGRQLFYDPVLSRDSTISCGSCHHQSYAFSDSGKVLSIGIGQKTGSRNAPPLMNLAWSDQFFWDGRVSGLDLQPIVPITSHVEMDETIGHVIIKLQRQKRYALLFNEVYGTKEISISSVTHSLSQFIIACISADSKYDKVMRKEGSYFTPDERAGYRLFIRHCSSCHTEPLFTDYSFRDNGIGPGLYKDDGRYSVTFQPKDILRFKVPSLRNNGFTAPYMHDGRFATLKQVLDHYSDKIGQTSNLDATLRIAGSSGLSFSDTEKEKLIAFLNTLNDTLFINNNALKYKTQ